MFSVDGSALQKDFFMVAFIAPWFMLTVAMTSALDVLLSWWKKCGICSARMRDWVEVNKKLSGCCCKQNSHHFALILHCATVFVIQSKNP